MATTCIIPCYNEAPRIGYVLKQLSKVRNIRKIIAVDDGSTDGTVKTIKSFKEVALVNHARNIGKAQAVRTGLMKTRSANILLFDADMRHFSPKEIEYAIAYFIDSQECDTLLLRTISDKWLQRLVKSDLVVTGCRLMRAKDLNLIMSKPIKGFQLEPALNDYYLSKKKTIMWMPFQGLGPRKKEKYGLRGILLDWKMFTEFFSYKGIVGYIRDVFCFTAQQI